MQYAVTIRTRHEPMSDDHKARPFVRWQFLEVATHELATTLACAIADSLSGDITVDVCKVATDVRGKRVYISCSW